MHKLDAKDQALLAAILPVREQIERPRMGDYVRFPTGELERFSHDWGAEFQTSPVPAASFYLHTHGNASVGGSLNPSTPLDSMRLTDESLDGTYWFFHHGEAGPGRRINFSIPCRVYATTAKYEGYLGCSKDR